MWNENRGGIAFIDTIEKLFRSIVGFSQSRNKILREYINKNKEIIFYKNYKYESEE
jgi:hypothetical protein